MAAAMEWICEHSMEHPGEWLALDGGVLLATGKSFKEVTEAAEAIGALLPLYHFVEPASEYPFVKAEFNGSLSI
ncbi:MAG: hypothetical protein L0Y75_05425 [Acidobacteria bacterium]|nr:hypothetical protein [Acidobacteriota bacterium]